MIALKVGDGLVLGADSASTIVAGNDYQNSYFNAEKLFNLRKGIPVGVLTYGLGGLSGRSVASLAKDLRKKLSDSADTSWYVDPATATVEELAGRLKQFFFDEHYAVEFASHLPAAPAMGFFIAGYSPGVGSGEIWSLEFSGGLCNGPTLLTAPTDPVDVRWQGQGEALQRLVRGWSLETGQRLLTAGMQPNDVRALLDSIAPMFSPIMPIKDAIDLVHFLIDTTCGFVRFAPGHASVAEPIDSAAITPHEGFRWIQRKYYFTEALNRPTAPHLP